MTYIDYINQFWKIDDDWQFTPCETRLYFYYLKTANRLGWVKTWERSDVRTASEVGVSVNTMKVARNRLKEAKLIAFVVGGKGRQNKTRYQLRCQSSYQKMTPKLTDRLTDIYKTKEIYNSNELFSEPEKPKRKPTAKKPKIEFIPPSLEEVKNYFDGKLPDWEEQADLFYNQIGRAHV